MEKVVNDPKKPIPNPIRTRGLTYPSNSVSYISIPSAKLPSTLTVSVSKGVAIALDNKNLEIAPKKPPVPTINRLPISLLVNPISIDQDNIYVLSFFISFHIFRNYDKTVGFCHRTQYPRSRCHQRMSNVAFKHHSCVCHVSFL